MDRGPIHLGEQRLHALGDLALFGHGRLNQLIN